MLHLSFKPNRALLLAVGAMGWWILAHAPSNAGAATNTFTADQLRHWAWQEVQTPTLPGTHDVGWVRTPVDSFVLSRLEKSGLKPSRPADRPSLMRRLALSVTGLPPSPDEMEAFVRDDSPTAVQNVVDRLLGSPRYGERMARLWLDLARYAESEGFKADETRPNAWRFRDYVIDSFNADKPYDRFVQEQIAGDELWPSDTHARIATAFNRHYPDESNARNLMQRRQEILNDITDTIGTAFCGLTIGCARCHDHKWDPLPQSDYYRLQAYFANTAADDHIVLLPPAELARYQAQLSEWESLTWTIRAEMAALEKPHREAMIADYVEKYPESIQVALKKSPGERTAFESQMVAKAKLYLDPDSHQYLAPTSACVGKMSNDEQARWKELKRSLETFSDRHPGKLPIGTGMANVGLAAPATHVLRRGNWDAPGEAVQPAFFSVLNRTTDRAWVEVAGLGPLRRAALARILTHPRNPLTARVMVNRVWQMHFGRGLVGTSGDFGLRGDAPTHPDLLDWLASEFVRSRWSIKNLHRLILLSNTFRQSSLAIDESLGGRSPAANTAGLLGTSDSVSFSPTRSDSDRPEMIRFVGPISVDPENHLLWHYPRGRLEGELIRDAALAVSGKLNLRMGGPGVFPELPPGMESRGGWPLTADLGERNRRSVYVFVRRNTRYPMFESFDMPDTHESCTRRNVTTSPVQALTLLNSRLTHEWAQSLAGRVLAIAGNDEGSQVDAAWRFAYGRSPKPDETAMAREFLAHHQEIIRSRFDAKEPLALPDPLPSGLSPTYGATLVDLCHALLNSNEFVYRN